MKKLLKWGLVLFAVFLIVMGIFITSSWSWISILIGTQGIEGTTSAIPGPAPAAAAALPELTAGPADWPCWRGTANDGRSPVTGIRTDWAGGLTKVWSIDFLCQGKASATWSAPVVKGNRLVVCGRDDESDLVFCLDPQTGSLIWQSGYKAPAGSAHGTGPRATPFIDDDRVYTFGRAGDLACWGLYDGKEMWRRSVKTEGGEEPQWGHSSSPFVLGDLVIVQAGGTARSMAFSKLTGEVAWKSGTGIAGYAAFMTAPIDGQIGLLVFHGKGLAALNPADGAILWDTPWETGYDVNATTPVYADGLVFITSNYDRGCQVLKPGTDGATVVWESKVIASHHSDPSIIDGHLYGYTGASMQNKGDFKCVELATGTEKWSTGAMGWGTCVWVDDRLLCCDIRGNLYLMQPDPAAFKLVASMPKALGDIGNGPVWTIPVIANDKLYLRFKQTLVCYDLKNSN